MFDQKLIPWYTLIEPEWRNRQTRATQNRVGLAHVGSIPTSGIWSDHIYPRGSTRRSRAGKQCPKNAAFLVVGWRHIQ